MSHPVRCGFLNEYGEPCVNPATRMARVPELNTYVPTCDACCEDRQTTTPSASTEPEA